MTTTLEAAIPISGGIQTGPMRQKLAESFALVINDPNAIATEAFATQPFNALVLSTDGAFYGYDPADTISAHDGSSVIVVSGRRYKRRGVVELNSTVLQSGLNTPPGSPALGDSYIVGPAPTGLWASQAKAVATYSARGWVFRAPFVGMMIYDVTSAGFQFYSAGGVWVPGLPIGAIAAGSVTPTKLADPFQMLKVEDTRSAPPGSLPAAGTAYIVGATPVSGFAGQFNNVARSNGSGYDFYTPSEGSTVYKKDAGVLYTFRSGVWGPTAPAAAVRRVWVRTRLNVNLGTIAANSRKSLDTVNIVSAPGRVLRVTLHTLSVTSGATADLSSGQTATMFAAVYKDTDTSSLGKFVEVSRVGASPGGTDILDCPSFGSDPPDRIIAPVVNLIGITDTLAHDWHLALRLNSPIPATSVVYALVQWVIEELESS